jgi:hypothetical protein
MSLVRVQAVRRWAVVAVGRGSGRPPLESQFFQVSPWRPDPRVLTPIRGPGTGFTTTSASTLPGVLRNLVLTTLPARLAGRVRLPVQPGFPQSASTAAAWLPSS